MKHSVPACVKIFRQIISTAEPAGGYVPVASVSIPSVITMVRARQDGPTVTGTGTARTFLRVRTGTTAGPVTACAGMTWSALQARAGSAAPRDTADAAGPVITS